MKSLYDGPQDTHTHTLYLNTQQQTPKQERGGKNKTYLQNAKTVQEYRSVVSMPKVETPKLTNRFAFLEKGADQTGRVMQDAEGS